MEKKRGQVWVETVIYTLIGLVIIGLVLAVSKPKIDEKRDEVLIGQAIDSLGNINNKLYEVQRAPGNRRAVDLGIGKGRVVIDMNQDSISWILGSSFAYSELGIDVDVGSITVLTTEASPYEVELSVAYEGVTLLFGDDVQTAQATGIKEFSSTAVPYRIVIENTGIDENTGDVVILLSEI